MTAGEEISGEVLRLEEGSLYPALHRMEEAGSIRAAWIIKDNGRRARVYELTPGDADNSPAKRLAGRLSRRRCNASSSWHKDCRGSMLCHRTSSYDRPRRRRPAAFLFAPPHCLKKNRNVFLSDFLSQ
jgi:hypothetical protein